MSSCQLASGCFLVLLQAVPARRQELLYPAAQRNPRWDNVLVRKSRCVAQRKFLTQYPNTVQISPCVAALPHYNIPSNSGTHNPHELPTERALDLEMPTFRPNQKQVRDFSKIPSFSATSFCVEHYCTSSRSFLTTSSSDTSSDLRNTATNVCQNATGGHISIVFTACTHTSGTVFLKGSYI